MEITGKIILALPEQSGVSKAGNSWRKNTFSKLSTHIPEKCISTFSVKKLTSFL